MGNPQGDLATSTKLCSDLNLAPGLQPTTPVSLDIPRNIFPEVDHEPHVSIEKFLPKIGIPTGKRKRRRAKDEEPILIEKFLPKIGIPTGKRKRRRAKDDELKLKTPIQPQMRKKIRPEVVFEGNTKRLISKSVVKKTVSAKNSEENSYIFRQRSTRRPLRFETLEKDPKSKSRNMTQNNGRNCLSMTPNNFWLHFPNIPRRQRTYATTSGIPTKDIIKKKRISQHAAFVAPSEIIPSKSEGNILNDYYISQNNHKKFGKRRSSLVTRPRNFQSLKRLLGGIVPIRHERRGYSARSPQFKPKESKIQSCIPRKKLNSRDPVASQLNAKVLQMQWQCLNATGTSYNEILELRFSVDVITKLCKELDINSESSGLPHNRDTALIQHKRTIQEQKKMMQNWRDGSNISGGKKNYQPKVILDDDKTDEGREEERKLFYNRANEFIAHMRILQGDRKFSPWKGSVVDSVVGVFLTQNVTDHSSSSAFMDIAAEFPINLKSDTRLNNEEWVNFVADEAMANLDMGNAIPTSIVKMDDEEDFDVGCTQETSITSDSSISSANQSKEVLLYPPRDELETPFSSEAIETVKGDEQEKIRKAEGKVVTRKKPKKGRPANEKPKESFDWDSLRRQAKNGAQERERAESTKDTVDWDALRCTDVNKIAAIIRKRGMHNILSKRIKAFLNKLVLDHGSINLEWLRDVPPDKAREYLLSIKGLGLKSVDCVTLLSLHQIAFPVDTNVRRIVVRLGWVPLQPLPDQLQMHLLERYPVLASVQKYLWPRLCKLDQKTLYELHYHMITFGKVFCTKILPNCNACPLKTVCQHYASAPGSARLALQKPKERKTEAAHNIRHKSKPKLINFQRSTFLNQGREQDSQKSRVPIIEEPKTPELECTVPDIEDYPWNDNKRTSTIIGSGTSEDNKDAIHASMFHKEACASKDLVVLSPQASSRPTHKLKNMEKLRTEHIVYELPDSHRILEGFEKREPGDMFPYLLAIWTPGKTVNTIEPPSRCVSQENDTLYSAKTCFSCNGTREEMSQIVRGTILIPCRTAMRGGFPLNGTYFQTNEVFADHSSSIDPVDVPREWIWNLPRSIVYFGSSVTTIFGGLSVEAIQYSFLRGYVCVRGFDRESRTSKTLVKRLHWLSRKQSQEDDDES